MSYFKRLETIFIVVVILILAVAYAFLNSQEIPPLPAENDQDASQSELMEETQQVPVSEISYQGEAGKTAMELLKTNFRVETQSFGDLGEFVKSINGVEPDNSHFWSLYVNGQQAQVGASAYVTASNDKLEWKLEEIK